MNTPFSIRNTQRYRYLLSREIDDASASCLLFVMLNPSTATRSRDDPTIRRCMGFAKRWGYGRLLVANLLALRATDPRVLTSAPRSEGAHNRTALRWAAQTADDIVVAWGNHGGRLAPATARWFLEMTDAAVLHLGKTQLGHPRHPLYVRADRRPQRWTGEFG